MPIITKLVHIKLALRGADAYSPVIDETIIENLNTQYAGTCMWECKVLRVLEVVQRSDVVADQHLQNSTFVVTAQVKISALVARPGDVMFGLTAVKIQGTGVVMLKNEHAAAFMRPSAATQMIREGQVVPVIVAKSEYLIGRSQITMNVLPFAPVVPRPRVYSFIVPEGGISPHIRDAVVRLRESITALIEGAPAATLAYYERLLYPFAGAGAAAAAPRISIDTMLEAVGGVQFSVNVPYALAAAEPAFERFDGQVLDLVGSDEVKALDESGTTASVTTSADDAIGELIVLHSQYIDTLGGLCTHYANPEEHSRLWGAYNDAKTAAAAAAARY